MCATAACLFQLISVFELFLCAYYVPSAQFLNVVDICFAAFQGGSDGGGCLFYQSSISLFQPEISRRVLGWENRRRTHEGVLLPRSGVRIEHRSV